MARTSSPKRLLLPRGYLSPSQIDLWLRDPDRYVRQYMFGGEEVKNARMDFGSKVALAEENGEETDDELVNMLVAILPKYPLREHTIRAPFKTKDGVVELLGKMDKFDDVLVALRDTKTGTAKWTQGRADKHGQLRFYGAVVWLKHKKIPTIHLDWAETKVEEDGSISLTGKISTFEVKLTLADILEYLAVVARVAREIDARYREEMRQLT